MLIELLHICGLALLPALGNFGGGLLSEWWRPSRQMLNRALHVATGIILAVVAVEVMPQALERAPGWLLAVAFFGGGVAYLLLESGVKLWQKRIHEGADKNAWMVYVAVATDLIGDGLLIGTGTAFSTSLGLILALGQVLADIPEGFAVIANFREKGMPKTTRVLVSASFVFPVVISALLAFTMLRQQSDTPKMFALVGVAGLYMLSAVEDMLREAHDSAEDSRWSALCLLGGFSLFLIVSEWN